MITKRWCLGSARVSVCSGHPSRSHCTVGINIIHCTGINIINCWKWHEPAARDRVSETLYPLTESDQPIRGQDVACLTNHGLGHWIFGSGVSSYDQSPGCLYTYRVMASICFLIQNATILPFSSLSSIATAQQKQMERTIIIFATQIGCKSTVVRKVLIHFSFQFWLDNYFLDPYNTLQFFLSCPESLKPT